MLSSPLRAGLAALATAVLCATGAAAAGTAGAAGVLPDPCPRTAALHPGPGRAPLFRTVAPFEHFDSGRSQLFPRTCTLAELTHSTTPRLRIRVAPASYATPYIAATRGRDELFVYGYGADAAKTGGFVASVSARTLRERWRTRITDTAPSGAWSYPGVLAVHGNGFVYAVYANNLVKLDPRTGRVVRRLTLPEDPAQTGAVYNGMVVLPDGTLAVKKLERGPCPESRPTDPAAVEAITGLQCAGRNALPSQLLLVDPDRLTLLDALQTAEAVTGRITATSFRGRTLIYCAGRDTLFRYVVGPGHRLALDRSWGPVTYRRGAEQPGTGPGVLGDWIVVQTNFLASEAPMRVTAVSQADGQRRYATFPFAEGLQPSSGLGTLRSFETSKASLDAVNHRVYTHDQGAGGLAALNFDPAHGFTTAWRVVNHSLGFSALVGPAHHRELVFNDNVGGLGDEAVWYDAATGRERLRSDRLTALTAPGNIIAPGFAGRFYYLSGEGHLMELRPVAGTR